MKKIEKKFNVFTVILLHFVLVFCCISIGYANNLVEIVDIKSFARIDDNIEIVDQRNGFFVAKFLLRKIEEYGGWNKKPYRQEFTIVDRQGEPYVGNIEKNDKICDFSESTRNYGCILHSFFPDWEKTKVYSDFIITIRSINKTVIDRIQGRMPELEVNLEKSADTLVLKNNHLETIEIVDVEGGDYIAAFAANQNPEISFDEFYSIKLKPKICTQAQSYFNDTIKIKYRIKSEHFVEGRILEGEITLACCCKQEQLVGFARSTAPNAKNSLAITQHGLSFIHVPQGRPITIWYTVKNLLDDKIDFTINEFAPATSIYRDHSIEDDCANSLYPNKDCSIKLVIYPVRSGIVTDNLIIIAKDQMVAPYVVKKIRLFVYERECIPELQITPLTLNNELGSIYSVICDKLVNIPVHYKTTDFDAVCKGSQQQKMQLEYLLENKSKKILTVNAINVLDVVANHDRAFQLHKKCQQLYPGDICKIVILFDYSQQERNINRVLNVEFASCSTAAWWCNNEEQYVQLPILISNSAYFKQ